MGPLGEHEIVKIPEPLKDKDLIKIYYFLKLNRMLEERLTALYKQGTITATVFTSRGQEAISVGSTYALASKDLVSPITRNLGTMLVRGIAPRDVFAQYMGKSAGPTAGKERIHYFGDLDKGLVASLSILGNMIPVMAGVAFANHWRGNDAVALTYLGDGAVSSGNFHEGMNMASVLNLPMVLIIENNGFAYSTPVNRQTAISDLSLKAKCYGIPGCQVDGNDVLAVYSQTKKALERARRGDGPSIIEAKTMRMSGHSDSDNNWYVATKTLEHWKKRDPILLYETQLETAGLLTDQRRAETEGQITTILDKELEIALSSSEPDGKSTLDGVYENQSGKQKNDTVSDNEN